MSLFDFRYALELIRNPGLQDFIRSGKGIEARYKRCEQFWKSHIDNCKAFQKTHIPSSASNDISILGAGRCLDIDLPFLLSQFEKVHLYDADPVCGSHWKKIAPRSLFGQKIIAHLKDLTGSLSDWTNSLRIFLSKEKSVNEKALAQFFLDLRVASQKLEPVEVVVSLNLLGQIPIYWRDRVHQLLLKHWNLETNERGFYSEPLQESLDKTFSILQAQHLELLSGSGADTIILFTDSNYSYFKPTIANWQVEQAIYVDDVVISGFECVAEDSWYWNLAPLGVEHPDYGEVHEVRARAFTRCF